MNDENYGRWITLKEEMMACSGCEFSSENRILDSGDRSARIMIVNDRPTDKECEENLMFCDTVGEYVDGMLTLVGIPPQSVYKTALVNCAGDGVLKSEYIGACIKCLRNQFKLVRPEIVICLGSRVAKTLIGDDFVLSRDHGKMINKGKVMFMGVPHPSSIKYNSATRDVILGDFINLQEFCKTYPEFRNL